MDTLRLVKQHAVPIDAFSADFTWIEDSLPGLGNAQLALLGEATHGTHDFYRMRAEITKRLITERGFRAVLLEADWPDAYRVNRYVRGFGSDPDAERALAGFKRFPTWMWRNADVLDFVGWLREYNDALPAHETKIGVYGMDLYSLQSSMEAVIRYLSEVDPQAADRARKRYACFDTFDGNAQEYGYFAGMGLSKTCEDAVLAQLRDLQHHTLQYLRDDGTLAEDELFFVEQNARVVQNAEAYYRTMLRSDISSWNLRDDHMVETLELLMQHLGRRGQTPKVAVWAHNSHVGDARCTQMGDRGERNVGELVRKKYGQKAYILGFTTYAGTVSAASSWDTPAERKQVRPAREDSFEGLFHATQIPRFALNLRQNDFLKYALREPRLERAIGVIYRPETERSSHYFYAQLGQQFDGILHLDHTRAVEPLERTAEWETGEVPETFPSAL